MPLLPAFSAAVNASRPWAFGASTPIPVTTTRCSELANGRSDPRHGASGHGGAVGERQDDVGPQFPAPPVDLARGDADRLAGLYDPLELDDRIGEQGQRLAELVAVHLKA